MTVSRIAILDLTTHPLPRLEGMPTVSRQIMDWLLPAMPDADFVPAAIAEGADFPDLSLVDGLVVSGSEYGVYDDVAWMAPLRDYLLKAKAMNKPMFGICFGHQIMADVFGGKAEKSVEGNHLGARRYSMGDTEVDAYVWHKDQVTMVPDGAKIFASAPYCPIGGLTYEFAAMSVQFHPEYNETQLRGLFDRFKDGFVPPSVAAQAIESMNRSQVHADLMAQEAAEFFQSNFEKHSA